MGLINSHSGNGVGGYPAAALDPGHAPGPGTAESPSTIPVKHARRPTVSVVIPVKNEARNIAWVLERIPDLVDEVILVDGSSTDVTGAMAKSVRPDVIIVTEERSGKGRALQSGFAASNSSIIVMLDGDGSMDPAEISRFVALLESGFDLVKGSRFMAGGESTDITTVRRLGNRGLLGFTNILFRANFTDLCYGFCAFRRCYLDVLDLTADGFEVETQLILHAWTAGLRISEVPSVESPRRSGLSKLHTFRDGRRVLETLWHERFGTVALPRFQQVRDSVT